MSWRRWLLLLLAPLVGAAIAIVAMLAGHAISSAEGAARTRTTAVGVGPREYRIALYRSRVLPGRVVCTLVDHEAQGIASRLRVVRRQ